VPISRETHMQSGPKRRAMKLDQIKCLNRTTATGEIVIRMKPINRVSKVGVIEILAGMRRKPTTERSNTASAQRKVIKERPSQEKAVTMTLAAKRVNKTNPRKLIS
jgi:hypothetical protein